MTTQEVDKNEKKTDNEKIPINIKKMIKSINDMESSIQQQRKQLSNMEKDFMKFKKFAISFIDFSKKTLEKKPRKPSGFQLPVLISDNLCNFLEIEKGSTLPRTEVTKYLIRYISDNNLVNPEKKTQIIPDEKLLQLLGNDVDLSNLTRFTIQKYMNCHFQTKKINI
jgi:chromatin remodeling complex protein RSC6